MTLTLDLTREEESRLAAAAREQGAEPTEVLKTLMRQHLPPVGVTPKPNEEALATLRDIARLKEGMPETDGSQTDQMLRAGRAGAIHGISWAASLYLTRTWMPCQFGSSTLRLL